MIYLVEKIPWFGNLSGYERLPEYSLKLGANVKTIWPRAGILPRVIGKVASIITNTGKVNQSTNAVRLEAAIKLFLASNEFIHILWGEDHLPYWNKFSPKLAKRTVYTFHQPASEWSDQAKANLSSVDSAIVLYKKDIPFFKKHCSSNCKISFVPYGVDVEFFQPASSDSEIRLLYNGVHLRNVEMFARVVELLNVRIPNVSIDALVPVHRRKGRIFEQLMGNPKITWHAGLNDEELRNLYQKAYLLLLPMNDSGASTAVVEALACGLPIVTTDMGGIRDYGGAHIFPLVNNNDDKAMVELIERYIKEPNWRNRISYDCRSFAVRELNWTTVAEKHLSVYNELFR